MRNLDGLELTCFERGRHFELTYAGGGVYLDPKGESIDDLLDVTCFACAASYYTRRGDPIPFCPNCGQIERKRFDRRDDLLEFLRGQDWSWLRVNGCRAVAVQTWEEQDWQLRILRDPEALEASGRYRAVRAL